MKSLPYASLPVGTVMSDGAIVTGPSYPVDPGVTPRDVWIGVPTDKGPRWGHKDQNVLVQS